MRTMFGFLLILFGLFVVVGAGYRFAQDVRLALWGGRAVGTVIGYHKLASATIRSSERNAPGAGATFNETSARAIVSFPGPSGPVEFVSNVSLPPVGVDQVTVAFNPADPARAVVVTPGLFFIGGGVVALGGLVVAVGLTLLRRPA